MLHHAQHGGIIFRHSRVCFPDGLIFLIAHIQLILVELHVPAVKDAVHVPVLGNGDIRTAEDAVRMVEETGCDGVMIARAALGDPWLFERVNAALEGLPAPKEPSLQARMNALRRQVEEMVEQKGEFVAMPQARAQTMHYMKGLKGAASLRRYCCELSRLSDLDTLIDAVFEQQRRAAQDPDDTREVPFP